MNDVTELIKAISGLVGTIIWPGLLVFVILRFRTNVAEFLRDLGEFSIKAPGLEASARRQQIEAAAALGAAVAERSSGPAAALRDSEAAASSIVDALPDLRSQRRLIGSIVLWVDDQPHSNLYERRALEVLGVRVIVATSTEEALRLLGNRSFDMIISDMGRPGDARAGYTLLDHLRSTGDRTPFFIYASSGAPEHIRESREHGAIGCTNQADELVEVVTSTIAARR